MANTKISELNAVTALAGTDVFPVVDVSASTTNKVSVTDLLRNAPAGTAGAPGIANADDQDTGILFPAANSIGVSTGGAQRLVIDSSGVVNIGTTAAADTDVKLQVAFTGGNSYIQIKSADSTGTSGIKFGRNSVANRAGIDWSASTDALQFRTGGALERLRLDSSGRFLVGTSSDISGSTNRLLQVVGANTAGIISVARNDQSVTAGNTLGKIEFYGNEGNTYHEIADITVAADDNHSATDKPTRITFNTTADNATSSTERVRIDSSGNVGVGDSNPNFTLDVNGNVGIREDNNLTFHDGAGVAAFRIRGTSDNKLFFERASGNEHQMVIDDGNVGIGTATAGRTLSVDGSIQVSNSTSGFGLGEGFEILHEPGGATYLLNRENAETRFYTNNTERARIDASGRLLVGSSSTVGGGSVGELLQIGFSGGSRAILANTSTSLASGALLGQIDFTTNVGSSISTGASIKANCDGTAGSGDAPTRLSFFTSADGASSPTERVRINKDGHVKYYGNSSSAWLLSPASDVSSYSQLDAHFPASNRTLFFNENTTNDSYVVWNRNSGSSGKGFGLEGQNFKVVQGSSEQLRVDSSGRLLIGSTSARANFYHSVVSPQVQQEGAGDFDRQAAIISSSSTGHFGAAFILAHQKSGSQGGNTALANGDVSGLLSFQANDGSHFLEHARIQASVDVASGTDDMPGALQFFTAADGAQTVTERARLNSSGTLCIGRTDSVNGTNKLALNGDGSNTIVGVQTGTTSATVNFAQFFDANGTSCGAISVNATANTTNYGTTSDYRLKENVADLTDAIARLNNLAPKRFNFITDPGQTKLDGFLAHEAQTVVPEAVTGAHNEVDDDGNPVHQSIDQSKLVPLLTAALQEAIAKIETLETKVAALEAQ